MAAPNDLVSAGEAIGRLEVEADERLDRLERDIGAGVISARDALSIAFAAGCGHEARRRAIVEADS